MFSCCQDNLTGGTRNERDLVVITADIAVTLAVVNLWHCCVRCSCEIWPQNDVFVKRMIIRAIIKENQERIIIT